MIKVFTGRVAPYNKYRIDEIKSTYIRQYIFEFTNVKGFLKWSKSVGRPIIGGNLLAIITENDWIRDISDNISKLEKYLDHEYIDILWLPLKNKLEQNTTMLDVIDLNKNMYNDMMKCISKDLTYAGEDLVKYILTKVNYRWETYVLYRDTLIENDVVDETTVNHIIKETPIKSASMVLNLIVFKKRYALNNYYKLQERYSKKWVKRYFSEELDKIIDAKIKLSKRETTISKIRNNDKLSKYFFIISEVPISHIQILRFLMNIRLGVEVWINSDVNTIIKDFMLAELQKGKIESI